MAACGDTFLGGAEVHGDDHLWVIINDPQAHDGTAVIVNVSTVREKTDTTCILRRGDHPFIKHDSYVRFRSAKKALVEELDVLIKARRLRPHQPADAAMVERIRAAASAALEFPEDLRPLL
jgi:mRNA-degrading endonuclease toxin of MazEF toxin-antitoxin module